MDRLGNWSTEGLIQLSLKPIEKLLLTSLGIALDLERGSNLPKATQQVSGKAQFASRDLLTLNPALVPPDHATLPQNPPDSGVWNAVEDASCDTGGSLITWTFKTRLNKSLIIENNFVLEGRQFFRSQFWHIFFSPLMSTIQHVTFFKVFSAH